MRVLSEQPNKKSYQDGNLRLKVFGASFKKSDILNEALNQARVEETGLQIPKLLEVKQIDGQWTIVTEFIEGETLESLMAAHPEKMTEYLEQFVALQSEILSKRAPLLNRLKDKMNRKIRESGLDATTRYELHMRLNGMREHEKICHGDFNPSNVIVTPDGDWYVIDWSHVTQGNASADAARTYLLFCLNGKEDVAEQYLQIFCEKNDIAKQYVRSWMPIVAASQLGKGKEDEREFLLRWANVVQYEEASCLMKKQVLLPIFIKSCKCPCGCLQLFCRWKNDLICGKNGTTCELTANRKRDIIIVRILIARILTVLEGGTSMKETLHYLLMTDHFLFQKTLFGKIKETGLSIGQPKVLDYLKEHDGTTQREIAAACQIEPASLTSILNGMEKANLIERKTLDGNRRSWHIFLTEKGKEQLKCVDAAFTEIEQTALQGFTAAEQQALCAYLLRIHKNFEPKA